MHHTPLACLLLLLVILIVLFVHATREIAVLDSFEYIGGWVVGVERQGAAYTVTIDHAPWGTKPILRRYGARDRLASVIEVGSCTNFISMKKCNVLVAISASKDTTDDDRPIDPVLFPRGLKEHVAVVKLFRKNRLR